MITVVGANILHEFDVSGPIVARTGHVLTSPELRERDISFDHSYDAIFDGPLERALDTVVDDLVERSTQGGLLYLLPGDGVPGDLTVEALSARADITLIPGTLHPGMSGLGRADVVDALEIALAENQGAFGRGLCPIDSTVPRIVTNWYGESVVSLATRRLMLAYNANEAEVRSWESDGRLFIPPVDPLEGPGSVAALEHIVARLRRPDGCPWDREQTRESLLPQFIEELGELGDAIKASDVPNQREELGDVLFHVVAQCQLAAEANDFTFEDVLREITAKLVRRHPHVFGDVQVDTYDDVLATWNRVKAEEKAALGQPEDG